MIAHWLERGLGHILAPDKNIPGKEPKSNSESIVSKVLLTVAPDPAYEDKLKSASKSADEQLIRPEIGSPPPQPASRVPPPDAFLSPVRDVEQFIQCQHCQKSTPIRSPLPAKQEERRKDEVFPADTLSKTPKAESEIDSRLARLVLSAAKETAKSRISSLDESKQRDKVFRLCGSTKALQDKLFSTLKSSLTKNPSLLRTRAYNMGQLAPDTYTPLMAAVNAQQIPAVKLILELDPEAHRAVDIYGRSVYHIAASEGYTDMINLLKEHDEAACYEPDLNGRTPLGTALTSPTPRAKRNRAQMGEQLFSPVDRSIFGMPLSPLDRERTHSSLEIAYGQAGMPGLRVVMEDAEIVHSWQNDAGVAFCLLGVCDGHGDGGLVSDFVSENIATLIQQKTSQKGPFNWQSVWNDVCLEVDSKLKADGRSGGSTAVCALITKDEIVVANVGDCRCILVQKDPTKGETGSSIPRLVDERAESSAPQAGSSNAEQDDNKAQTAAGQETAPPQEQVKAETTPVHASGGSEAGNCVIYPLSEDHKPNLEEEKSRIENAGMSVIAEAFEENGHQVTIHKIKKSATNMMAVSRSFGDFEYKNNKEKGPEEQAVIALPEIRTYSRDSDADQFLVLACDGIWDVMSNEEVGKFVQEQFEKLPEEFDGGKGNLSQISDKLLRECFDRKSGDNLSAIVVALSKTMAKFSGGKMEGKALKFASPKPEK